MILESALGLSLVLNVSLESKTPLSIDSTVGQELSTSQRQATLLPLVHRVTECIIREVATSPRYSNDMRPAEINDLIIDSITFCSRPVRAMIDAHDRLFGSGSGEAFLLGPYLDILPSAVIQQVKVKATR